MTLIGLGHVARVGKDVAAAALVRDLGYTRIGFADALKDIAYRTDPLVIPQAGAINVSIGHGNLANVVRREGWEGAKDRYPEVRRFLQNLGVAVRDVLGEDVWVDHVLARVEGNVVISDVRFLNEAEAIKRAGGFLVRIDRPGHLPSGHVSELELADFDGWDKVLDNNATIPELEAEIVRWAKTLERKAA